MDAREIELLEIDGVWQVRAPKKREEPRKRRVRLWAWVALLSPVWVSAIMAFAIVHFGDAFIADAETAGIVTLLSCWATMFVLSALEGLRGR